MSSFFRDSNLFASRNSKPLFGGKEHQTEEPKLLSSISNKFDIHRDQKKTKPLEYSNNNLKREYNDDEIGDDKTKTEDTEEPTDDDEIEITDVKTISGPNQQKQQQQVNNDHDINTSMINNSMDNSNDLSNTTTETVVNQITNEDDKSLEYLLNTIAHLNERNSRLNNQVAQFNKQNKSLVEKLNIKTEAVKTMKIQISKFKGSLQTLQILFHEVKRDFLANKNSKEELVAELVIAKKNVANQHEVFVSLKNLVGKIKTELTANEITMNQKNINIENLKKKNNELAGRLSEQKLKNTSLSKQIVENSNFYESNLINVNEKYQNLVEKFDLRELEYEDKWKNLVDCFQNKFSESFHWKKESLEILKVILHDNFNDLALKMTDLSSTTENVQLKVVKQHKLVEALKKEFICMLSDVDKNLAAALEQKSQFIAKKMECIPTTLYLDTELSGVRDVVNTVSEKDNQIKALQDERYMLKDINSTLQNQIASLNQETAAKSKEMINLNAQIASIQLNNRNLCDEKDSKIQTLQKEIQTLSASVEQISLKLLGEAEQYKQQIQNINIESKKLEAQNIKLFKEEKNKIIQLTEELENVKSEYAQQAINYDNELQLLGSCNKKIKELENELTSQNTSNPSNEEIAKLNNKIDIFKDNVIEKQKLVDSLRNTIFENEKTIAELNNKLKSLDTLKLPPHIKDLFTESRTSTAIKQEPLSQIKVEKHKTVGNTMAKTAKAIFDPNASTLSKVTPKVRKPEIAKSNNTNAKRKLLDSSQDSGKSQSLQKNRSESLKKSILDDLDIFNEFVAMDRMETIGKPGW